MIVAMELMHLDQVLTIEQEIFALPWSRNDFIYELQENKYAHYSVLVSDEKVVAFCGLWCLFDQAQITNIAVTKANQKKGNGSLLMNHMLQTAINFGCETISLEVRVSNIQAISMYKKYGFEILSVRKGYYQDNHEDAYLMMKAIGGIENGG